jgi:hypothetical protein
MRSKVFISVLVALAMLLSFGSMYDRADADAILFPWIVKSEAISTLVSVVNTATINPLAIPFQGTPQLHWSYYYKDDNGSVDNSQTQSCADFDFKMDTSQMDVVTVDAAGNINGGAPMWGDTNNPTSVGISGALQAPGDRRAYLIVDNNTPTLSLPTQLTNLDGTLYGEAMIIELATGAAWGYVAYNSGGPFGDPLITMPVPISTTCDAGQNGFVSFANGLDPHGEVIGETWAYTPGPLPGQTTPVFVVGELAPTVLMPPSDVFTRMFLTPVDDLFAAVYFAVPPFNCNAQQWANIGQRARDTNSTLALNARIGVCSYPNVCGPGWGLAACPAGAACGSISGICIAGGCASPGITLNDESPVSSTRLKNIVCTSADDISALLDAGTMVSWNANGGQAWTYMRTTMGNILPNTSYQYTPNMMIGKLEWADEGGTTIDGTTIGDAFNNFLHLRSNKDNFFSGLNSVPFGNNNIVPIPPF